LAPTAKASPTPIVPKGPESSRWPPDAGAARQGNLTERIHGKSQAYRKKKESSP
jgi:hypothetical protein